MFACFVIAKTPEEAILIARMYVSDEEMKYWTPEHIDIVDLYILEDNILFGADNGFILGFPLKMQMVALGLLNSILNEK